MPRSVLIIVCFIFLFCSCGGKQVVEIDSHPAQTVEVAKVPSHISQTEEFKSIQELAQRNVVSAEEAIRISNRMLQEEIVSVLDEQTLNNLEKILLAALPQSGKEAQSVIQRNMGIVNFYNKNYHKARQALQYSNETNPRDPRTHYYLARLFDHQARIYESKGDAIRAQRHQKRAQIEIDTARKLEPGNPLYRQKLPSLGD
ncbi:MAG: hypothetical protein FJ135_07830 [Deltaproteobacteria bacterium]|nr:hypothetical protein [Deltaproteobacteria bacterium]